MKEMEDGKQVTGPGDWSQIVSAVNALSKIPYITITRLLRILEDELLRDGIRNEKNIFARKLATIPGHRHYRDKTPVLKIVPINNHYFPVPSHLNNEMIVPSVIDLVDDQTDALVEFGCGYGRNLFMLRDLLEHRFPRLQYFGGEFSDTGLQAAAQITELEKLRSPISFAKFNYLEPEFDFLSGHRRIVAFTAHSIEQVSNIGHRFFDGLLAAAKEVTCFHAEPVGWQFNAQVMMQIQKEDIASRPKSNISVFGKVDDHYSARVAITNGWNQDLKAQLTKLANEKRIKVKFIEPSITGNESYNPTTHILWQKT